MANMWEGQVNWWTQLKFSSVTHCVLYTEQKIQVILPNKVVLLKKFWYYEEYEKNLDSFKITYWGV